MFTKNCGVISIFPAPSNLKSKKFGLSLDIGLATYRYLSTPLFQSDPFTGLENGNLPKNNLPNELSILPEVALVAYSVGLTVERR